MQPDSPNLQQESIQILSKWLCRRSPRRKNCCFMNSLPCPVLRVLKRARCSGCRSLLFSKWIIQSDGQQEARSNGVPTPPHSLKPWAVSTVRRQKCAFHHLMTSQKMSGLWSFLSRFVSYATWDQGFSWGVVGIRWVWHFITRQVEMNKLEIGAEGFKQGDVWEFW